MYDWGHCPFGRPICDCCLEMLLQHIHIIVLSHDSIYFVKCTRPSCSKTPPQHDTATSMLHDWNGVLQLASLPFFPPNITMVIMAKQFYFCFIRPEDISTKSTIFVQLQIVVWHFNAVSWSDILMQFWSSCHALTLVPFLCLYFSLVRAWVGVDILCFGSVCYISRCLAWYGSQSEAAVNHCLWLRTILRQPVSPLWGAGLYFVHVLFRRRYCAPDRYDPVFWVGLCFPFQCLHHTGTVSVFVYSLLLLYLVFS